jgi:tRNA dimethylallyltransferase
MKEPLIVLSGPTAVGKTQLSINLAKAVNGSIISADSAQVYRYMDIGSAKIRPEEMQGVKHYLIDVLDPSVPFDVVTFQKMAKEAMQEIRAEGKIPIIVGGTGFYIQAVLNDICFEEEGGDKEYRHSLEKLATENGDALYEKLKECDPASAESIHPNNQKRVIRALEFYHENGYPISEHNAQQKERSSPYQFAYFVLNQDRKILYERIEKRVDLMMEEGFLDEVRFLKEKGYERSLVSMQALGYKQLLAYLDGEYSLEEAIYIIKRDTRHFAKRQLTWFRREKDMIFLDKGEFTSEDQILEKMLEILKEEKIYE